VATTSSFAVAATVHVGHRYFVVVRLGKGRVESRLEVATGKLVLSMVALTGSIGVVVEVVYWEDRVTITSSFTVQARRTTAIHPNKVIDHNKAKPMEGNFRVPISFETMVASSCFNSSHSNLPIYRCLFTL
jgi:hypothetical protein